MEKNQSNSVDSCWTDFETALNLINPTKKENNENNVEDIKEKTKKSVERIMQKLIRHGMESFVNLYNGTKKSDIVKNCNRIQRNGMKYTCNLYNEESFGFKDIIKNKVYVCSCGIVHDCEFCSGIYDELSNNNVCPITGLFFILL